MDEMYDDDDVNDDNSNGDDIVGINSRTVVDASWVGFLRQEHSTAQAENTCPSIPSMRMTTTTMTKRVRKTTLRNASRAGLGQQSTLDNIFPSFSTFILIIMVMMMMLIVSQHGAWRWNKSKKKTDCGDPCSSSKSERETTQPL